MTFTLSASHLKLFFLCPRSYFLKHVLRVPDDQGAGGLYLTRGNDFDRLVQLRVRDGVTGDSGAPKLANRQLAEALRYLPPPKTAEVQFSYNIDAGEFRVKGKPDLRRPGWIEDTKTTSDRGPGRGAAEDRPPYALTDAHTPGGNPRPLADDEQALLYSWCEFQLDPALTTVHARWIYVSKADCPHSWISEADFGREETEAWFDAVVRPAAAEMAALHEKARTGLTAEGVGGNPDSCRRCFVRASCPGAFDGVNVYGLTEPQNRGKGMAFDLSKLKSAKAPAAPTPPPSPALETQLAASVEAAVAINRPASQRPAPLTVSTIEGPGAAYLQLEFEAEDKKTASVFEAIAPSGPIPEAHAEETPPTPKATNQTNPAPTSGADIAEATSIQTADAPEETPPAPKARRGRPRKTTPESAPAASGETIAGDAADPKAPAPTTIAPGCAPSAGALAVAVRALIDAVRALECHGKTGAALADAEEALGLVSLGGRS